MASTSKVVQIKSPPLEELATSKSSQDFHKIHLCKSCGSAALRHSAKNPADDMLNIVIPVRIYQCYSCGSRNRFIKDTLRGKLTLIGLSILAAMLVVFVLNKNFMPEPKVVTEENRTIISPLPRSIQFDLSYRIPSYFDIEPTGLEQVDQAIKQADALKPASIEEEKLTDGTIAPAQPTTVNATLDLSSEVESAEIVKDQPTAFFTPFKYYTIVLGNSQDTAETLYKQNVTQPLFVTGQDQDRSYYYGSFKSEASAKEAVTALSAQVAVNDLTITALRNINTRLALLTN